MTALRMAGAMLLLAVICRAEPQPPPAPARAQLEAALVKPQAVTNKLCLILLADKKDHKVNEHDYPLWQDRWALLLGGKAASEAKQVNLFGDAIAGANVADGAEQVEVLRATSWPTAEQFAKANVIVAFCYLPWTAERKQELQRYRERGGGLVLIHSATWTKPKADLEVAALVGVGGFTRWRHGELKINLTAAEHPICRGLPKQMTFFDEPYWPPTPPPAAGRVTALAVSQEEDTATKQATAQPIFWTTETGRGRVFGCVPGHYVWTFDDPWFRLLLLRGIAWAAGGDVHRLDPLALRGARVAER